MSVTLKVPIEITGEDKASAVFNKVAASAGNMAGKITAAATAYLAFDKIMGRLAQTMELIFDAGIKNETAFNKLSMALKVANKYTDEAANGIRDWATEMQRVSGIGHEVIEQAIAQNVVMGLGIEQAKTLTQSALGLAKAQGIDLAQANKMLTDTLRGEGSELGKIIPQIQSMARVSLATGGAIDIVGDKFRKFITSDATTSQGTIDRLKQSLEGITEVAGGALLEGLNLPDSFQKILPILDEVKKAIVDNREQFVKLGKLISDTIIPTMRLLKDLFVDLAPTIGDNTIKILNLITVALNPLLNVVSLIGQAWAAFKGDDALAKQFEEVGKAGLKAAEDLAGIERVNLPAGGQFRPAGANEGEKPRKGTDVTSEEMASTTVEPPAARKFGKSPLPLPRDIGEEQLRFQRAINNEVMQAELEQGNLIVAEHSQRSQKIVDLQREAALKGYNISQQAFRAQTLLAETYTKKLKQQYDEQRIFGAQAAGRTTDAINLQYKREVDDLGEKFAKEELLYDEYLDAIAEAERKRSESARQTTGSAKLDDQLGKATSLVSSVQGGLNSTVSAIGSMFGPWGNFISTTFSVLNQAPDKFREMVTGFIKQLMDAPKFIAQNIPILVAELAHSLPDAVQSGFTDGLTLLPEIVINSLSAALETLPTALGKIFSAGFWGGIIDTLYKTLLDAFRNFFSVLFGGKPLKSALATQAPATPKREAAVFGSDDPNAGGAEFKIRDASTRASRKAEQDFDTQFQSTVEDGGKTFTDMLGDAFQGIIEWFKGLPKAIVDGLLALVDDVEKLGGMILDGMINAADKMQTFAQKLAKFIIDALGVLAGNVKIAFGALGDGIIQAFIGGLGTLLSAPYWAQFGQGIINGILTFGAGLEAVGRAFGAMGAMIWHAFYDAVVSLGPIVDPLLKIGEVIVQGLVRGLGNMASAAAMFGHQIVDGLMDMLTNKNGNISSIGTNIGSSIVSGANAAVAKLAAVGKPIADGFIGAMSALGTGLAGVGQAIANGVIASMMGTKSVLEDLGKGVGSSIYQTFTNSLASARDWIADFGKNIYFGFVNSLAAARTWISGFGTEIYNGFHDALAPMGNWIKGFGTEIYNGLHSALTGGVPGFVKVGSSIYDGFISSLEGARDWIKSFGSTMYQGLVDGLYAARDWIRKLFTVGGGGVTGLPGYHDGGTVSPSWSQPALAAAFATMGALRFADGGTVPGIGFHDTVPALLTPNERVRPAGSGPELGVTININVASGGSLDRDSIRKDLMPVIIETIKRESRRGNRVADARGVY